MTEIYLHNGSLNGKAKSYLLYLNIESYEFMAALFSLLLTSNSQNKITTNDIFYKTEFSINWYEKQS